MEKFEFLYSDEQKFVPVHLNRLNYGYAPLGGLLDFAEEIVQPKQFTFIFPQNRDKSGYVVFLIDRTGANGLEEMVGIQILLPGETQVTLITPETTETNKEYYIYIMSKDFEDGYVSINNKVTVQISENAKIFATTETVNFDVDGGLIESTEQSDINEWYNYQGSYINDTLIWNQEDV